jgi:hypothetical protein
MKINRAAACLLVATGLALTAAAGCTDPGGPGPGHPTTTKPTPSKFLVQYHEEGGHCQAACPEESATIGADGSWSATTGPVATNGTLAPAQLQELKGLIRSEAGRLGSLPPSSGCPSAYDGRDIEVSFSTDGGRVTVSNCTKDFDGSRLLQHTIGLVDSFT